MELIPLETALQGLGIDRNQLARLVRSGRLTYRSEGLAAGFLRQELEAVRASLQGATPRDVLVELTPSADLEVGYTRHAVLVGVSTFAGTVPNLRYAEDDARSLSNVLMDPACGMFEPANVRLLAGGEATLSEVKRALGEFLGRGVAAEDLVVLFFATHGVVSHGEGYLLLSDSTPENPYGTCLAMSELARWLNQLPSRQVVVMLDACHSGHTAQSREFVQRLAAFSSQAGDRVVIASCAGGERSLEVDADRQGLFTKHLLSALSGEADTNQDGVVDVLEVFNYVQAAVPEEARQHGESQTPTWWGRVSGLVELSRNRLSLEGPEKGAILRSVGPRLLLRDEVGPRTRIRLQGQRTSVGRSPDCDVQLMGDAYVSRNHVRFVRDGQSVTLEVHEGAEDRTWVNDEPVRGRRPLRDGDAVRLGRTELEFWGGEPSTRRRGGSERRVKMTSDLFEHGLGTAPSREAIAERARQAEEQLRDLFEAFNPTLLQEGGAETPREVGRWLSEARELSLPLQVAEQGCGLAFTPNGLLLTLSRDLHLRVLSLGPTGAVEEQALELPRPSGRITRWLRGGGGGEVPCVACSPTGEVALASPLESAVRIYAGLHRLAEPQCTLPQAGRVLALGWAPQVPGKFWSWRMAIASEGKGGPCLRAYGGLSEQSFVEIASGRPSAFSFSACGRILALGDEDERIRLFESGEEVPRGTLDLSSRGCTALSLLLVEDSSPILFAVNGEGEAVALHAGEERPLLEPGSGPFTSLAGDRDRLILGAEDGRVVLRTPGRALALGGLEGRVESLALSPDGRWVVASSQSQVLAWPTEALGD